MMDNDIKIIVFNNGIITEKGLSGSDNRAVNWSKIWAKQFAVTVVMPSAGIERYKNHPVKKVITTSSISCDPSSLMTFLEYLKRVIKAFSVLDFNLKGNNIIYSSSDLLPDALPALYMKFHNRRNSKVKLIMGCHLLAPNPLGGYKNKIGFPSLKNIYYYLTQKLILALAGKYADVMLVSNGRDRGELIERRSFAGEKVLVTYGGVDYEAINATDASEKKYDAVFIGRLHPQKGLPDLFSAWQMVCRTRENALLLVIGEDNIGEHFESKVRELGIGDNINWTGFLSGREKYAAIKAARLSIVPSYHESFGMVAAEAMACGLPVVAYDLPVFREVYPEGMVRAPKGDVQGLAAAVVRLLLDEEELNRVSSKASVMGKSFTWESTSEQILERVI